MLCIQKAKCVQHTVTLVGRNVIKWCTTHTVTPRNNKHAHTGTGTGTQTNTKWSCTDQSLPVRDQETSILRGEYVKMFQKVIHHQTTVTSVPEVGRKASKYHPTLRIGAILCKVYTPSREAILLTATYIMGKSLR